MLNLLKQFQTLAIEGFSLLILESCIEDFKILKKRGHYTLQWVYRKQEQVQTGSKFILIFPNLKEPGFMSDFQRKLFMKECKKNVFNFEKCF